MYQFLHEVFRASISIYFLELSLVHIYCPSGMYHIICVHYLIFRKKIRQSRLSLLLNQILANKQTTDANNIHSSLFLYLPPILLFLKKINPDCIITIFHFILHYHCDFRFWNILAIFVWVSISAHLTSAVLLCFAVMLIVVCVSGCWNCAGVLSGW